MVGDLPAPAADLRHPRAAPDDRDDRGRAGGPGAHRNDPDSDRVGPDPRAATRGTHRRGAVSGRRGRGDRRCVAANGRVGVRREGLRRGDPGAGLPRHRRGAGSGDGPATHPATNDLWTPRWRCFSRNAPCRGRRQHRHRRRADMRSMVAVTAVANTSVLDDRRRPRPGRGRGEGRAPVGASPTWRTRQSVPRPAPGPPAACSFGGARAAAGPAGPGLPGQPPGTGAAAVDHLTSAPPRDRTGSSGRAAGPRRRGSDVAGATGARPRAHGRVVVVAGSSAFSARRRPRRTASSS